MAMGRRGLCVKLEGLISIQRDVQPVARRQRGQAVTFRTNYRCCKKGCRKRYTFPKPLENYKIFPYQHYGLTEGGRCGQRIGGKICGGFLSDCTKSVKNWNHRIRRRKGLVCYCGAIPFPHTKGQSAIVRKGTAAPVLRGNTAYCEYHDWSRNSDFQDDYGGEHVGLDTLLGFV